MEGEELTNRFKRYAADEEESGIEGRVNESIKALGIVVIVLIVILGIWLLSS